MRAIAALSSASIRRNAPSRGPRIGSRYVSGRTRAWLKTKNPDFERR
jgi:hypothetical protein